MINPIKEVLRGRPAQGTVVELWTAEGYRPVHHRLTYYDKATWKQVFPDDDDKRGPGAPFIDEWWCEREDGNEEFYGTGRGTGWSFPLRLLKSTDRDIMPHYLTRQEAVDVCRANLIKAIERYKEQLNEAQTALAELK